MSTAHPGEPERDLARLDGLQILRALAAALVIFDHGIYNFRSKIAGLAGDPVTLELGDFGVRLFFCISGFIIFLSVARLRPGRASARLFAVRRLIRIVPLYWLATLIYAAKLAIEGKPPAATELVYSLFFVPYSPNGLSFMTPVLGMGWTLNFEMFFYALLGTSLFVRPGWRLPLVSSAIFLLLLSALAGLVPSSQNVALQALHLLAAPELLFFVSGMVLGALAQAGLLSAFRPLRGEGELIALVVLTVAGSVAVGLIGPGLIAGHWLVATACVLLCATWNHSIGALPSTDSGPLASLRELVVLAGDASYSSYLTHGFVMGPLARLTQKLGLDLTPIGFSMAMVLICTAVGMVVYRYVEKPMLRKLNRRWAAPEALEAQAHPGKLPAVVVSRSP
jgi:exopolysaccharide production protein ExoZ